MGFAESLVLLGTSYDSAAAVALADELAAFLAAEAREASRRLAESRGVFPSWERSVYAARGERLRNATCLSIAPTGTVSLIADTSGGIEPLFALASPGHTRPLRHRDGNLTAAAPRGPAGVPATRRQRGRETINLPVRSCSRKAIPAPAGFERAPT